MFDPPWPASEKKLARRLFAAALAVELRQVMSEFKAKAAAAIGPDDMWAVEDYLRAQRQRIDAKYDYRYSRLPRLFARLLREGRLQDSDLDGFAEERRSDIRRLASDD